MIDHLNPYAAHTVFIAPALEKRDISRVICVMIGFEIVFFLSPLVVEAFLPTAGAVDAYYTGVTPGGTLAQFFTFLVPAFGLAMLLRMFHGRDVVTLIGPTRIAKRDLIRVGIAVALVLAVIEVMPPWIILDELQEIRDPLRWAALIPVALLALLIQTGTEELYFRGYLQQQMAALSLSRFMWMGVPSVFFGAGHYFNGFGPADGIIWAIWAFLLGLACADLTARTGSIGAAVGLHLANNVFAVMIVGVAGWPASGLALFLYPYDDPYAYDYTLGSLAHPATLFELLTLTAAVLVMWLAARIAIRR